MTDSHKIAHKLHLNYLETRRMAPGLNLEWIPEAVVALKALPCVSDEDRQPQLAAVHTLNPGVAVGMTPVEPLRLVEAVGDDEDDDPAA